MATERLDVVWDMETQDPDDFITLLLLLGHPDVRLRAVTVTPGSTAQIGFVRRALAWFGASIPVGARDIDHPKPCVSSWHYRAFGDVPPSRDARPGAEVLAEHCDERATLITGGPLKNLGAAMKLPGFRLGRLVAQGGFAGEGVVPPERQLPKFRGRVTCPTFNLNGDPKSALRALEHPGISVRRFVSKNVCHGVVYDAALHEVVGRARAGSPSLERIWAAMDVYLQRKVERAGGDEAKRVDEAIDAPRVALVASDGQRLGVVATGQALARARAEGRALVEVGPGEDPPVCRIMAPPHVVTIEDVQGKMFHDPLAACCAIDEAIGTWAEVEVYREKGEWGARLREGTGTWIITGYDHARFLDVLLRR